jgi:hypothetical protein
MKYTFNLIEASDQDDFGDGDGREKIILESRAGESARHIALKILAYLLFRDAPEAEGQPVRIEQSVGQRHKPDLVATESGTDRVLLWIDCGQIETQRLGRIAAKNNGARILVLKPTEREARLYVSAAAKHMPELGKPGTAESVRCLGFDPDFLTDVLAEVRGVNTLMIQKRFPDLLALTWNTRALATSLHFFAM